MTIPKILTRIMEGEGVLACPVCEDHWLHICKVRVVQGPRIDEIWDQGSTTRLDATPQGRGSRVETLIVGECGHSFTLVVEFHKGQIFMSAENCGTKSTPGWPPELWRD